MTLIQNLTAQDIAHTSNRSMRSDLSSAPLLAPARQRVAEVRYGNVETALDPVSKVFWCHLNPRGRPSFTAALLDDLHRVQRSIADLAGPQEGAAEPSVRWVVLASRTPGIFSLGGDLALFSSKIRAGDREGLRRYAHGCVEIGHRNASGYGAGAVSIGLAQGEALGGGFESLLSCDVLVAERRSRFGLPEILFNLFPGMGAHAYLTRRVGAAQAERMMLSGKVYNAEEMYAAGIVDVLAENGEGEAAVRDYVRRNASRHNAHSAIHRARRRVSPVTLEELRDVTDIWVDAAMQLTEQDLRRMAHLVAAQDRNRRRESVPQVAAE